jgi:c-di-GMP-binding flagellar brake protein YcgR
MGRRKDRKKKTGDELPEEARDTDLTDEPEQPGKKKQPPEDFPGSERRRHRRVKVKLHMIYEDGQTGIKTNVVNISLGGAFLEMSKPPQEGTEIQLTPILPEKGPGAADLHLKGRVVRVVEYNLPDVGSKLGVGIEFTNISNAEKNALAEIFKKSVDGAKSEADKADKKDEPDEDADESSKTGEWTPSDVK